MLTTLLNKALDVFDIFLKTFFTLTLAYILFRSILSAQERHVTYQSHLRVSPATTKEAAIPCRKTNNTAVTAVSNSRRPGSNSTRTPVHTPPAKKGNKEENTTVLSPSLQTALDNIATVGTTSVPANVTKKNKVVTSSDVDTNAANNNLSMTDDITDISGALLLSSAPDEAMDTPQGCHRSNSSNSSNSSNKDQISLEDNGDDIQQNSAEDPYPLLSLKYAPSPSPSLSSPPIMKHPSSVSAAYAPATPIGNGSFSYTPPLVLSPSISTSTIGSDNPSPEASQSSPSRPKQRRVSRVGELVHRFETGVVNPSSVATSPRNDSITFLHQRINTDTNAAYRASSSYSPIMCHSPNSQAATATRAIDYRSIGFRPAFTTWEKRITETNPILVPSPSQSTPVWTNTRLKYGQQTRRRSSKSN